MMLFAALSIAVIVFLIGFFVGVSIEPPIEKYKFERKANKELERIKTEYDNFLNYDGSEQQ